MDRQLEAERLRHENEIAEFPGERVKIIGKEMRRPDFGYGGTRIHEPIEMRFHHRGDEGGVRVAGMLRRTHLNQPGGLPAPQQIASAAQHVGFTALYVDLHERHAVHRLGHQIDGEQIDALALAFRTQKMVRRVALELQDTRSGRRGRRRVMADHLCAVRARIGLQAHEIAKLRFYGYHRVEIAEDGVWDRRQPDIRADIDQSAAAGQSVPQEHFHTCSGFRRLDRAARPV